MLKAVMFATLPGLVNDTNRSSSKVEEKEVNRELIFSVFLNEKLGKGKEVRGARI